LSVISYKNKTPQIPKSVFSADTARIIGDVTMGERSSVWYGAVVRGDQARVVIGSGANLQDGVVAHVSENQPCVIGDYVTIGHNAVAHACVIGSFTLVGVGSVALDGSVIGEGSIIAAGSVVPPGKEFPPRSFILGAPGRLVREVTEEEYNRNIRIAESYIKLAAEYMSGGHGSR